MNHDPPIKPDHLDAIASEKWDQMIEAMGDLRRIDGELLEAYCVTYSGYRKALSNVDRTGQVLVTKKDGGDVEVKRNPFSVEFHKYSDRLARLLSEMGATPKGNLKPTQQNDEDNYDDDDEEQVVYQFG